MPAVVTGGSQGNGLGSPESSVEAWVQILQPAPEQNESKVASTQSFHIEFYKHSYIFRPRLYLVKP